MIHGVLPAAGLASRMRGLPKFLLPASPEYETLLERHVRLMEPFCETIWIPTRPDLVSLISSLGLATERVKVLQMTTESMTETIMKTSSLSGASKLIVVMPDTFFQGELPYEYLRDARNPMNLAVWRIRDEQKGKLGQVKLATAPEGFVLDAKDKDSSCEYIHAWGAMSLDTEVLSFATADMPHTGYLIPELIGSEIPVHAREIQGNYYDCGTPKEYIQMFRTEVAESIQTV
jgi:hypothetical protein